MPMTLNLCLWKTLVILKQNQIKYRVWGLRRRRREANKWLGEGMGSREGVVRRGHSKRRRWSRYRRSIWRALRTLRVWTSTEIIKMRETLHSCDSKPMRESKTRTKNVIWMNRKIEGKRRLSSQASLITSIFSKLTRLNTHPLAFLSQELATSHSKWEVQTT